MSTRPSTFWIGDELVKQGLLTETQLESAITRYREHQKGTLAEVLENLALVTPRKIAEIYAQRHQLQTIDLTPGLVDRTVARTLSRSRSIDLVAIPFRGTKNAIEVAVANPATFPPTQAAAEFPGREILLRVAPKKDILAQIEEAHRELTAIENNADYLRALIETMIAERASDLHVEVMPNTVRIRKRIDGVLSDHTYIKRDANNSLVQAVKTEARLNISERRLPQDGQFGYELGSRKYTFRVSTLPCQFGENCVVRIQDEFSNIRSFEELGMFPDDVARMTDIMSLPNGLVYFTGPTGSGKTTLMYSGLATLPARELKIITAEEPVEYVIPDYNQVSINERIKNEHYALSFRDILRTFVRQDPDVILIGESRDVETTKLAIHAALTGHLVLSTLHTRDATGVITRLNSWKREGVEPVLVKEAVTAAIAQRLVRRVCPHCRRPHPHAEALRRQYRVPEGMLYEANAAGCAQCTKGYRGRIGVFETFRFDQSKQVQTMILAEADGDEIRRALIEEGQARTMLDDGLRKVAAGLTTLEAVLAELLS